MNEFIINLRQEQLRELQEYVKDIEKDVTLILQSLQWDKKHLQQGKEMVTCKYDSNHRIPARNVKEHEETCYLKCLNYLPGDLLFPEPLDSNADTVVKLSVENINEIIDNAVQGDSSFKRGSSSLVPGHAPLTLGGLQAVFTADERRALHDAVVGAAPPPARCDVPARDPGTDGTAPRCSVAAELRALRDARRRRARHRRAARDGYRHELRGLISAQMESFAGDRNERDADAGVEPDVATDDLDYDDRRCERRSVRTDHGRDDARAKSTNPNKREHTETRENKRREYERESGYHSRWEFKRENGKGGRGDYERLSRSDQRREYEYDNKSKERNIFFEHDDRKHRRQYNKECLEIKLEVDHSTADRRKREKGSYDCKNRKRERSISSSRDKKKYHRREDRHHRHESTERRKGRSRDGI